MRFNVTLGDESFSEEEVWAALEVARADGFVRELSEGLDQPVGERGGSLSGGQRQRIALARAIIRRPRLLVLDDATSAVDPSVERAILTRLRDGRAGMTVLVVGHGMATIALADRVVVVAGGPRVADVLHGVASPSLGAGLTTAIGGALVVVLTILLSRPGSPFVRYRAPVA